MPANSRLVTITDLPSKAVLATRAVAVFFLWKLRLQRTGGLHLTSREAELAEVAVDLGSRYNLSGLHRPRLGRSALALDVIGGLLLGLGWSAFYPVAPGAVAAGAELALGPQTPRQGDHPRT